MAKRVPMRRLAKASTARGKSRIKSGRRDSRKALPAAPATPPACENDVPSKNRARSATFLASRMLWVMPG
jgi:hypothetical protein